MMFRLLLAVLVLFITFAPAASAQTLQARANEIRAAMDVRDFERAEQLTRDLRAASPSAFAHNNYDYLLARLAERRGASAEAAALYLGLLSRNSSAHRAMIMHWPPRSDSMSLTAPPASSPTNSMPCAAPAFICSIATGRRLALTCSTSSSAFPKALTAPKRSIKRATRSIART